jgi:hypothetical protein
MIFWDFFFATLLNTPPCIGFVSTKQSDARGEKTRFAGENLFGVSAAFCLAKKMGEKLGKRAVL